MAVAASAKFQYPIEQPTNAEVGSTFGLGAMLSAETIARYLPTRYARLPWFCSSS
jgi:hypothetical protein